MSVNKIVDIELADLESMPWMPHPTIPGVTTRFREVSLATHPVVDTMIARVEPEKWIPWHRHGESAELAYVIEGIGRLWETDSADCGESGSDGAEARDLRPGSALFIPVGACHAVENIGTSYLIIFAAHTLAVDGLQAEEVAGQ